MFSHQPVRVPFVGLGFPAPSPISSFLASLRYHPWGTIRYANGSTPTRYQYTGQYSFAGEFGLLDFKARYYDPQLGRFAAPDSIIPQGQGVQAWDRYAYANNSPVVYNDPNGHCIFCAVVIALVLAATSPAWESIIEELKQPPIENNTVGIVGRLV